MKSVCEDTFYNTYKLKLGKIWILTLAYNKKSEVLFIVPNLKPRESYHSEGSVIIYFAMANKLLKSGYTEKQVYDFRIHYFQAGFRKKWSRRFLELRESEIKWYVEEGEQCDGYLSLKDIQSVEEADYSVDKPQCLTITLVRSVHSISYIQMNKKVYWFAFETVLERNSWKAAIEDAKTLFIQNQNGSDKSSLTGEIAVRTNDEQMTYRKRLIPSLDLF